MFLAKTTHNPLALQNMEALNEYMPLYLIMVRFVALLLLLCLSSLGLG